MERKTDLNNSVAVVGAGIAGIAASIRLAIKGYRVHVFEANNHPGGKLSEIESHGYRFDAGPSLFTLPQLVDDLFSLAGKIPSDYFKYERLSILCRYFYEDGKILTAFSDRNKLIEEFTAKTNDTAESINKFFHKSKLLYGALSELFMERSLHKLDTFLSKKAFQTYLKIPQLNFFKTMNGANEANFTDPHLVQLFNRYATYNGSDPYQTPATMNIIPHLEYNLGAYFPTEGMYSITEALVKLAEELGVKFYYNCYVQKIEVEKQKVTGIVVNNELRHYSIVVNNMDMVNAYKKLLSDQPAPKRLLNQPKSSSALIFYWGIKKEFKELELHNIFFSEDYKKEFEYIFKRKEICCDPTVYINITSKHKPDDATPGGENWFVMINVPHNSGQDWEKFIAEARINILKKLSRLLKTQIEPLVEFEAILDPRTIESRTSSAQGALYGNSSNNKYAAFLRHANFSSSIRNLFFCGGSVHPGGGIPLSLLSAKIVSGFIPSIKN